MNFLLPVLQDFELSQSGEKIGFERRQVDLTDVRVNRGFCKGLFGNDQGE